MADDDVRAEIEELKRGLFPHRYPQENVIPYRPTEWEIKQKAKSDALKAMQMAHNEECKRIWADTRAEHAHAERERIAAWHANETARNLARVELQKAQEKLDEYDRKQRRPILDVIAEAREEINRYAEPIPFVDPNLPPLPGWKDVPPYTSGSPFHGHGVSEGRNGRFVFGQPAPQEQPVRASLNGTSEKRAVADAVELAKSAFRRRDRKP